MNLTMAKEELHMVIEFCYEVENSVLAAKDCQKLQKEIFPNFQSYSERSTANVKYDIEQLSTCSGDNKQAFYL